MSRWLDEDETTRWQRFRHPRPKRQFVLCRSALRALLCERIGCSNGDLRVVAGDHGKPHAMVRGAPARVGFSVSHSGEHGMIALSREARVGVDVEVRRTRHDVGGRIATAFSEAEQTALATAEGDDKTTLFFRLWTLREALIKALGTGFSIDTSLFKIPPAMYRRCATGRFRSPHLPHVEWRLDDLGNGAFAAALAQDVPSCDENRR